MIKKVEILFVKYNGLNVGRLALNRNYLAVFEYDSEWLQSGFSISPLHLPLKSGAFLSKRDPFGGLFGVFNDSLPDGWGSLLLDRVLRSRRIEPISLSVLDRLSIVGNNGMGALSYEPETFLSDSGSDIDLDYFAAEAEKILRSQPSEAIETLYEFNGSSGGARPKVIVNIDGEDWMIKFGALYDPENIGEIEYNCSLAAINAGIEMSETKLFNNKHFGVKLFDRNNQQKFHVHTASGLLYADYRIPSLDYDDLFKLTMYLTKDAIELEKMFKLMIFNVLLGNKDDHAKNFSFIYKNEQWKLSPAYDLTPNNGFNGNHSTTVLGKGKPSVSDIIELGKKHGINVNKTNLFIDKTQAALQSGQMHTL